MRFDIHRTGPAIALTGLALAAVSLPAPASSHREAPFIATQPKVDGTDFYMFRSYEPGRAGFVTLIANYQPLEDAGAGPYYYPFDQNALYEIHIDNNGDAREDLTFQFRFKNTLKDFALPVGGRSVPIPLIHKGPISAVNDANLNLRETYTLDVVRGDRRGGTRARVTNAAGGGQEFDKPVDYIGDKTFGSQAGYEAYANRHVYNINIPGCATAARMFVGQRKDPFQISVGRIFDLINLNPVGPEVNGNPDDLARKMVSTLALEVPIACLTNGTEPVIGGYTTASVRQGRLMNGAPAQGFATSAINGGPWVQVSRLGMPLVNEVVIGAKDKDRFNASRPSGDAAFLEYVQYPTLPALVGAIFGNAAPPPTNFPRTDLVAAFLTGLAPLNKPANVVPSEMMRLNTSIAPVPVAGQNPLGAAAGDNAGFPNGRRPGDDVVDIELRVAMGALCVLTGPTDALGVGCNASQAPAGGAAITDGVRNTAAQYPAAFPYLATPLRGAPN